MQVMCAILYMYATCVFSGVIGNQRERVMIIIIHYCRDTDII